MRRTLVEELTEDINTRIEAYQRDYDAASDTFVLEGGDSDYQALALKNHGALKALELFLPNIIAICQEHAKEQSDGKS